MFLNVNTYSFEKFYMFKQIHYIQNTSSLSVYFWNNSLQWQKLRVFDEIATMTYSEYHYKTYQTIGNEYVTLNVFVTVRCF